MLFKVISHSCVRSIKFSPWFGKKCQLNRKLDLNLAKGMIIWRFSERVEISTCKIQLKFHLDKIVFFFKMALQK